MGYFADISQAEACTTCIYMHLRTCTYACRHAHTHFSVFIGCCDGDIGWNGREPTTGLVMLIFFFLASRAHTHDVCVCTCQCRCVCMTDFRVFFLFVGGGWWHCRNGDFIGLLLMLEYCIRGTSNMPCPHGGICHLRTIPLFFVNGATSSGLGQPTQLDCLSPQHVWWAQRIVCGLGSGAWANVTIANCRCA